MVWVRFRLSVMMGDKKPRGPSSGRAHSKKWLSIRRLFLPETGEP